VGMRKIQKKTKMLSKYLAAFLKLDSRIYQSYFCL